MADGNTRANRLCRAQVSDLALNSCLTLGMSSLYIFCFFPGIFLVFFVVVVLFFFFCLRQIYYLTVLKVISPKWVSPGLWSFLISKVKNNPDSLGN